MKKQLSLVIEGTCEECVYSHVDNDGESVWCSHPDIEGDNFISSTSATYRTPILPNCPLPDAP